MPQLHHVCSQLMNAFHATHFQSVFPYSQTNLHFLQCLYRLGYLTAIQLGGLTQPYERPKNPAEKRIYVHLNPFPSLISEIRQHSKPSRRVFAQPDELTTLLSGRSVERLKKCGVHPLSPCETMIVSTPKGVLDLLGCVENQVGGEVICTIR